MGFLDNLENNLKADENRQERASRDRGDRRRTTQDPATAAATATYAESLRKSKFTSDLLDYAVRIGHAHRVKIYMTWIGATLRLEARERKLELVPGPAGIEARFYEANEPTASEPVDLNGNGHELAERWLQGLGRRSA